MRTTPLIAYVLTCVLLLGLPGQASAALFGEITIKDEIELGREFDQKVREQMPVLDDPMISSYVADVVKRIVDAMPNKLPYPVTTTVINNRSMNAFAIPGGYVYVFTGLIMGLDNEDELAAVLCHELAHVSQRHVAKRYEDMQLASLGSLLGMIGGAILGIAGGGSNAAAAGQALMMGSQAGAASAYLLYTQENEREADHVGMNYLLASGYNPEGMPNTFETMLKKKWTNPSSSMPSYLSTHPGLSERIGYLQDRIKRMPPEYMQRTTDNERFLRVQAVIKGRIDDPGMVLAAYDEQAEHTCLDHMAAGMAALRLSKDSLARQLYEKALECGGNDPLVLREAGRFYFKAGDFDKAQPLLQKALFLDPSDMLTLFYNARLLGERKQYASAIENMNKVLKNMPQDSEVHYYLGRMLGESGDLFHAHVHLAYSAIYAKDRDQAEFHINQARGFAKTPEQQAELAELERMSQAKPGEPEPGAQPGDKP